MLNVRQRPRVFITLIPSSFVGVENMNLSLLQKMLLSTSSGITLNPRRSEDLILRSEVVSARCFRENSLLEM